MQNRPRLLRDDEHELPLPDDLALLAEQLSRDAENLASLYPAKLLPPIAGAAPESAGRTWFAAAGWRGAAAAVLLAALGAWGAGRIYDRTEAQPGPRRSFSPVARRESAQPRAAAASFSPAAVLDQLSPSEREGVLDVLEDARLRQGSFSI